jgi:hypothetical protein
MPPSLVAHNRGHRREGISAERVRERVKESLKDFDLFKSHTIQNCHPSVSVITRGTSCTLSSDRPGD